MYYVKTWGMYVCMYVCMYHAFITSCLAPGKTSAFKASMALSSCREYHCAGCSNPSNSPVFAFFTGEIWDSHVCIYVCMYVCMVIPGFKRLKQTGLSFSPTDSCTRWMKISGSWCQSSGRLNGSEVWYMCVCVCMYVLRKVCLYSIRINIWMFAWL